MNMEITKALTSVLSLYKRNVDGCGGDAILMRNYKNSYEGLRNEITAQTNNICAVINKMNDTDNMELLKTMIIHIVRTEPNWKRIKEKYPLIYESVKNLSYVIMTRLGTCSNVPLRDVMKRTETIAHMVADIVKEFNDGLAGFTERYKYFGKNLLNILHANAKLMAFVYIITTFPFEKTDTQALKDFGEKIWDLLDQTPEVIQKAEDVIDKTFDVMAYLETIASSKIMPMAQYQIYAPYWLSKTSFNGGRFYNSLIDMMWDATNRIWVSDIREKGQIIWHSSRVDPQYASFSIMNPPVWDMNMEKLNAELARLQKTA